MTGRAAIFVYGLATFVSVAVAAAFGAQATDQSPGLSCIHAFAGRDGAWSRGSLLLRGHTLFGRTAIGGAHNAGTVFAIDIDGSGFISLYSFTAGAANGLGNQPHHNAMFFHDGALLGAALYGGSDRNWSVQPSFTLPLNPRPPPTVQQGNGTLFSIKPDGAAYRPLLVFEGGTTQSAFPHSPPLLAPDGRTLYGLTASGGDHGDGTLYAARIDGTGYTLVHSFHGSDGNDPHGMVILDRGGTKLLGMTRQGGNPPAGAGGGVIFSYDLGHGPYRVLHVFRAGSTEDGDTNDHGYLTDIAGTLYGVTSLGGARLQGVIFSMKEDGTSFTILHSFGAPGDGAQPFGSLVPLNGSLYGTTMLGGTNGDGTLFRLEIGSNAYEQLASFDRTTTGAFPEDNVTPSADGRTLFGLTQSGGVNDPQATNYYGTVFAFTLSP